MSPGSGNFVPARSSEDEDTRELLLRLLPVSSSLAGLSVGAVTLFRFSDRAQRLASYADDVLVVCASLFLLATYLVFWALRTRQPARSRLLARIVDAVFLVALTALVAVGFTMVYALW